MTLSTLIVDQCLSVNTIQYMIRTVNSLLVAGVAIMVVACGIIEEADTTPPTETLMGAPEWAIQENLIVSTRISRDTVLDFGERGKIEIIGWDTPDRGVTPVHFRSTGGAESLMDHVLFRDKHMIYPRLPGGTLGGRVLPPRKTVLFATEAWAIMSVGEGVLEIYEQWLVGDQFPGPGVCGLVPHSYLPASS